MFWDMYLHVILIITRIFWIVTVSLKYVIIKERLKGRPDSMVTSGIIARVIEPTQWVNDRREEKWLLSTLPRSPGFERSNSKGRLPYSNTWWHHPQFPWKECFYSNWYESRFLPNSIGWGKLIFMHFQHAIWQIPNALWLVLQKCSRESTHIHIYIMVNIYRFQTRLLPLPVYIYILYYYILCYTRYTACRLAGWVTFLHTAVMATVVICRVRNLACAAASALGKERYNG